MIGEVNINASQDTMRQEFSMELIFMYLWILPYILLAYIGTKDRIGFLCITAMGLITWGICLSAYLQLSL